MLSVLGTIGAILDVEGNENIDEVRSKRKDYEPPGPIYRYLQER
jgi:hypothetical protein